MLATYFYLFLLALVTINAQKTPQSIATDNEVFRPYEGVRSDSFDWALSKALAAENPGTNMFISPISIKILLILLSEGAAGSTKKELETLLELPTERQQALQRIQNIITSLRTPNEAYDLQMETRLFLDSAFKGKQRYAAILKIFYQTIIEPINFSETDVARNTINNWAKNVTHNRIQDLVTEDDMQNAVLMLMNAIYFKGMWKHAFPKNQTHVGQFYATLQQQVPVTYMSVSAPFFYCESSELDAQIIRLPYMGDKFSMFVFLPNSKLGLNQLLHDLDPTSYKRHLRLMKIVTAQVILPKISFEFTARLASTLQQLGLREIFEVTASLPGIARGQVFEKNLVVSNVLQKAGVDINEEGTTAFAATTIQLGNKFADPDIVFNAVHPFVVLIEDETSGSIIFFGKVENPSQVAAETKEPALRPKPTKPPVVLQVQQTTTPLPVDNNPIDKQQEFLSVPPALDDEALNRANFFDIEIIQAACVSAPGNVLISPVSVKIALAVILEGAKDQTAAELQAALRLPENRGASRRYIDTLLTDLRRRSDGVQLKVANKIYHSDRLVPLVSYKNLVQTSYATEIQGVNFENNKNAAEIINSWVNQMTLGTINSILGAEQLNPNTLLMMLNVLYFKGEWYKEFPKRDTVSRCFYISAETCVSTNMMHLHDKFRYAAIPRLNSQAVDLPYKDLGYSMLLLIPNHKEGITQLVRDLPHNSIHDIIRSMNTTEIALSVPKFKVEHAQDLVGVLKSLEINKLFTSSADLSGIVGPSSNIGIDSVHHKVSLELNEEGSVAAAATGAAIIPLIGSTIPQVRADHPFLLFLYDTNSGNVLFGGRISNPT